MNNQVKIGSKITALVLVVVVIAVAVISFIAYDVTKKAAGERYAENLRVINRLKSQKIEFFFNQIQAAVQLMGTMPAVKDQIFLLSSAKEDIRATAEAALDASLLPFKDKYHLQNIYLADTEGTIIYQVNEKSSAALGDWLPVLCGKLAQEAPETLLHSDVFPENDDYRMLFAVPVPGKSTTAVLVGEISMQPVYSMLSDTTSLQKTGEFVLGKRNNGNIIYLNPLRHKPDAVLQEAPFASIYTLESGINGGEGIALETDYRNQSTIAAWTYIPSVKWGLVAKIDTDEVYAPINKLRNNFLLTGLIILLGAFGISVIFSRFLTNSLLSLKSTMSLLGEGILPNQIAANSNDEIGEMVETVNVLVEGLKKTADFAHKIGAGDFDADFKPMSKNDMLGLSLLNMRDSIQDSAKRDDEQKWIVTGIAEIGDILRSTNNLEELGERVIAYITDKIGAIQGAFYVVNDEETDDPVIEMTASYAYSKKKYLQGRFRFAEGLVGQAAIEQDTILRTEVPDSYVTITSGLLGDRKPKCLLIVPLITIIGSERVVYGVLEFAGFEKFSQRNVRFVNEVSEIIARTIFNIKVNETTRKLLERSQKQGEELQEQQEILRQNAEEMQATQEELKRTNHALEEQIEEVNRAQKRMQVLLENASEVITIYEVDRRIRYVSPSVEKILGYRPEEMNGINDITYVHEMGVEAVNRMFEELIEHPEKKITIQFSYLRKNGDQIWLEATGTNLLADPAIEGIVVNSRDITERLLAEKEQRMRGQMQALSENSPDLITRFNKEGEVFYINPVIEAYTGHHKEEFLKRPIAELSLDASVIDSWNAILSDVISRQEKIATEMGFPSVMGDRVMQVNAIPEYNEQRAIESVLVVSHDITDRKIIELEIQSKNKKITESINYAKRIQSAILPDNAHVEKIFTDAFILYKPRDVVSGDFPWFLQKGDDYYIAAVDCTGHGVPGALISLIGYFLLNNIVTNKEGSDPGEVLDLLDQGVTQTLKQDSSDSSTRDGMDIALCKINLKKRTLHYAGAHRPLYCLQQGELVEVKGDKFPIGGGQYKERTNFKTTEISIQPGDSVYFCSDGFPDQFGGPENRKFSPKRIRDIITANAGASMAEVHAIFDREFEAWKGDTKQTDDVLMIGIRF
jgi:PAS domain S-box-containing protein